MAARILGSRLKVLQGLESPLKSACGCVRYAQTAAVKDDSIALNPITKVLIANRGEIACRVIHTAKKMGIRSVACYSDADKNSMHVALADESYYIGPSPATESYLRMDKIIDVAKRSGAQAIHPGYGFLSEKPEFANLCEEEGITFVGPPSSAITDMGIKSTSKHIMDAADVPIIRGYHGEVQDDETLRLEAEKIGYPVMLKAVRGGGGKGMRIVNTPQEFQSSLDSARNEARKAFDDDKMLVEKFVERPRHVEVQVFADRHDNIVYLFERDCSVQRRHQKIIEEAPAPGLSDSVRREIGEAAVRAARAVGYVGAGTVEFIMDAQQNFYFMEMNTRLQVEHPISEMITGMDLVELQLRAAGGEVLPFTQDDLKINGHAFEARIYAEDPDSDFLPGTGKLDYLSTPAANPQTRIETGVRSGDEVSQYYDPMIAKLVVWDECRWSALQALKRKLKDYHVVGLSTNLNFLSSLASHPHFEKADVHTGFIEEHYAELFPPKQPLTTHQFAQTALALLIEETETANARQRLEANSPFNATQGFQMNLLTNRKFNLSHGETTRGVNVSFLRDGKFEMEIDGDKFVCSGSTIEEDGKRLFSTDINGQRAKYSMVTKDGSVHVFTADERFTVEKEVPKFIREQMQVSAPQGAVAPMTGTILDIRVNVGDVVAEGDIVAVIYAMKLEHSIAAPYNGVVEEVFVATGGMVDQNEELMKIKETTEE